MEANQVGGSERSRSSPSFAGRYGLVRRLSEGGSGHVYLVEQDAKRTLRVLKVLAGQASPQQIRSEFARLTELSHPSIVKLVDAGILGQGIDAGHAFLVTDYVTGSSLSDHLAAAPDLSIRQTRFFAACEALMDALAYLHGQGIVHGDISPANVRCREDGLPVLIDFGLAAKGDIPATGVSGTLGYIAPEALLGERRPAGDLFSLGATLYEAWTGTAPFGVGVEAVKRTWSGLPPAPSSLLDGLPAAWDALLLHLLAASSADRPASAREALATIRGLIPGRLVSLASELAVPYPAGDPLAGVVVGRENELAQLRRHMENLADGASPTNVVFVAGQPGSGRRTLIRSTIREARMSVLSESIPAIDIEESECSELVRRASTEGANLVPSAALDVAAQRKSLLARVATWIEARAQEQPLCLSLSGSEEDVDLAKILARSPPSGRLLVLVPCVEREDSEGSRSLSPQPFSREAISDLARRGAGKTPSREILDRIATASGGLAGVCTLLVRSWIQSVREGEPERLSVDGADQDLVGLLENGIANLDESTRAYLLDVALGLAVDGGQAGETTSRIEGEGAARAAGWLSDARLELASTLHAAALWRFLGRDVHLQARARARVDRLADDDPRAGEVLLALGDPRRAAERFWAAMRSSLRKMSWSQAASFGWRAHQAEVGSGSTEDVLSATNALGSLGRYEDATALLNSVRATDEGATVLDARILERKAWLLGRRGEPKEARAILETALARMDGQTDMAKLLRARLARLLVSSGEFEQALAVAESLTRDGSEAGAAAREAAVLAHVYAGNLAAARRLLEPKVDESTDDPLALAKRAALEGLVEQVGGNLVRAAESYRRAVSGYATSGDLHGAATATFNLGCVLAETGKFTEAIEALERAVRELGRLGVRTDYALAIFNVGELFLQLGDLGAANKAAERLRGEVGSAELEAFTGYAALLSGNILRREGRGPECLLAYDTALAAFSRTGMKNAALLARAGRAEALALTSHLATARSVLEALSHAEGMPSSDGQGAADADGDQVLLSTARVALLDPDAAHSARIALADRLGEVAARARTSGRLPVAWRATGLAAQLLALAGDTRAPVAREQALSVLEEVKMSTPTKYWTGLAADPDVRPLTSSNAKESGPVGSAELVRRGTVLEGHLRRLLRINKRLNSDLRLSRVLETIVDTVIELTDAERGFLLLRDGSGELAVKVARNIDQTTLEGPSLSLSRSIAKQAADSGQPVVTVDAAGDSRFSDLLSVSDLHLRSVLAVPLTVKGQVVGTIYVDHRLRKGVFGDDEVSMVLDFAEQGAIAIDNARMLSELRKREQQVQSLNRRLERELKVQEAALSDARIELKESRHVAALRYDYRQIVGQSTGMQDLFRLLDRVTDTNLPVVIEGESGTGKELVARAIHFHGPRKDKAFVSENCAAIPETLLESTLFGHVRGAFTGADREARGLFSVANGGTLFLDEVAEMSPAMQGKLLRVLQDGEFHRVGGERAEKVDVRVLVATNKSLSQMVEDGKFRKDLFYRLSVVQLRLPPLRDRREDIPLLVQHFVKKSASSGAAKEVEPAAMAKLAGYAWPGNVRELENEIARASAFAGASIGVSDLSAHIQSGQDPNEVVRSESDNLRLRQRVERLERHLIREAFGKAQGNQTKAAALLGLSRFGLQKKLRRYNLSGR